jgi:hypothetical protein
MEAKVPLLNPHGGNPCPLSIVQQRLDRCFQASTAFEIFGTLAAFAQGMISRPEVQTKLFLLIRTQNATLIGQGATAMGPKRHEVSCLFHLSLSLEQLRLPIVRQCHACVLTFLITASRCLLSFHVLFFRLP